MAHFFVRAAASNALGAIRRTSYGALRTVFSSSGIGLDNFKLSREQYASRNNSATNSFKQRFMNSINQAEVPIFTEDLRNMILAAETDEDVDAVIQALKKYNSGKMKFTEFHFGSPIMRLLYIFNKPDLAMQLFMDESLKEIFRDAGSALILMNKLIEDQRYDDAGKIFDYACQRGFSTSTGRAFPGDVVTLAVEALYRQNTKQSFVKAKELLEKITDLESEINPRTGAMIALLAIQQNEPLFAMELISALRSKNLTTLRNIRAICYADLNRVEEAMNVVHLLADQAPVDNDRRRIFPLVLTHIGRAVEKSKNPDLQQRFEDLSKFISQNDRLSTVDLLDFLNDPINRRSAVGSHRPGSQQTYTAGPQRSTGNQRYAGVRGSYRQ